MERQEMIPGTNTALSLQCDDFLEALRDFQQSKEVYANARKEMAKALDAAGKNKVYHGGKCIEFVEGSVSEDTVKVSNDRDG